MSRPGAILTICETRRAAKCECLVSDFAGVSSVGVSLLLPPVWTLPTVIRQLSGSLSGSLSDSLSDLLSDLLSVFFTLVTKYDELEVFIGRYDGEEKIVLRV